MWCGVCQSCVITTLSKPFVDIAHFFTPVEKVGFGAEARDSRIIKVGNRLTGEEHAPDFGEGVFFEYGEADV
jgi:hypothetical protein